MVEELKTQARELIDEFKGDNYAYGIGGIEKIGKIAALYGKNVILITSFSLVDILSHGRACAILSPYYTVFFSPTIQNQLKQLAEIFSKYGLVTENVITLSGKDLGLTVANGLIALAKRVGFPTTLGEIEGMTESHVTRALRGAKNPQLESKLKNMPVPLKASSVDEYMGSILEASMNGDFGLIKTIDSYE